MMGGSVDPLAFNTSNLILVLSTWYIILLFIVPFLSMSFYGHETVADTVTDKMVHVSERHIIDLSAHSCCCCMLGSNLVQYSIILY